MIYRCNSCQASFDTLQTDLTSGFCPACGERFNGRFAGTLVRDFHVIGELARGANGIVYAAQQPLLRRDVALKLLLDENASDQEHVEQFFAEARAAARVAHPNIVQAYAVGEDEGIFFFAMEFIDGKTMKEIMQEKENVILHRIGC